MEKWTHPALTENAVVESSIEQYLMQELGIVEGLQQKLLLDQSVLPSDLPVPEKQGTGTY